VGDLGVTAAPRLFAHRGSSADEPENTLAAFRRARIDGADGVELDVMRCASGEIMVFHDDELTRLCGVSGVLREKRFAELSALRVRGEPIPQLHEVIETIGPSLQLNVELKTASNFRARLVDDGLARAVAETLRRHEVGARTIVSSFDPFLLRRFRREDPTVRVGLLFAADQSRPLRRAWAAPLLGVEAVHPEAALVDERSVKAWRDRHLAVNVWTVDDPAEIVYLASLGVDGIITNRPREARAALTAVRLAS
jgi:glycerophosphoryl diester phosphodiesterase